MGLLAHGYSAAGGAACSLPAGASGAAPRRGRRSADSLDAMTRWHVRLRIGIARPWARGRSARGRRAAGRRRRAPPRRRARFSVDLEVLARVRERRLHDLADQRRRAALLVLARSASASLTVLPRTRSTTGRALQRRDACASGGPRGTSCWPWLPGRPPLGRRLLALRSVWPRNSARRGELAELVPDHVLGHEDLQELVAVVDHERVPDELGRRSCSARDQVLIGSLRPASSIALDAAAGGSRRRTGPS